MLQKTYRVHQILDAYGDCDDVQKKIMQAVTTCYIEETYTFIITKEDFEGFYDGVVSPAYAVECFDEVNAMLAYTFRFNLEYMDSDTWWLTATMINRVYDNLSSDL